MVPLTSRLVICRVRWVIHSTPTHFLSKFCFFLFFFGRKDWSEATFFSFSAENEHGGLRTFVIGQSAGLTSRRGRMKMQ